MLYVYAACLAFGGGFVVLSSFFGGGDDLDMDGDLDGGDVSLWFPLLSLKFWFYALASFGLTGLVLTLALGGVLLPLLVALPTGLSIGWVVHWVFRRLAMDGDGSMAGTDRLLGAEAEVRVALRGNLPGEVRVMIGERPLDVIAVLDGGEGSLSAGERVSIIGLSDDGKARVIPVRTFLEEGSHE